MAVLPPKPRGLVCLGQGWGLGASSVLVCVAAGTPRGSRHAMRACRVQVPVTEEPQVPRLMLRLRERRGAGVSLTFTADALLSCPPVLL